MVIEIAALDLWTLFVNYIFGGFWLSIIGIAGLIFIIMGPLGKISVYSTLLYIMMFVLAMAIGWMPFFALPITILLLVGAFFAWKGYFEK